MVINLILSIFVVTELTTNTTNISCLGSVFYDNCLIRHILLGHNLLYL